MQFHACDNGPRTFSGLNSPNGHASTPSLILNRLYLWLETRRCGAFAGVQNDVKSVGVFARLSICVGLFIRVKKLGLTRRRRTTWIFFSLLLYWPLTYPLFDQYVYSKLRVYVRRVQWPRANKRVANKMNHGSVSWKRTSNTKYTDWNRLFCQLNDPMGLPSTEYARINLAVCLVTIFYTQ